MTITLNASHVVNFPELTGSSENSSWEAVGLSVGYSGAICRLFRERLSIRTQDNGLATFPLTLTTPHHYKVQIWQHGKLTETALGLHEQVYQHFVLLGDSKALLACARCRRSPEGIVDKNIKVIDLKNARATNQMTFGDGINDIQSTPSGTIWCSFGDEGIFGNFGWGRPDGPEPLGASGLVAYDDLGNRVFEYQSSPAINSIDLSISDCYAMNVVGEAAWICPYTDFPLIKVGLSGKAEWWTLPPDVAFCTGFAIHKDNALFWAKDNIFHLKLNEVGSTKIVAKYSLPSHDGQSAILGREETLYFMNGSSVFSIDASAV
jgi:hypothetical protein